MSLTESVTGGVSATRSLGRASNDRRHASGTLRFYPDGRKTHILVSEDNISSLALSAQRIKDHIVSSYKAGGVSVESVIPVGQIGLNTDMHHTELHIDIMPATGGQKLSFAFPPAAARLLLDALPSWVDKIEHAKPVSH